MLLAYEVTRDFPLSPLPIETPLEKMTAYVLNGKKIVFVSILRAGNGILDGMLRILPSARVGHIGIYRDPKSLVAVEYYCKMPPDMESRNAIIVDPMLVTGHSAIAAVDRLNETKPRSTKFVCLVRRRTGSRRFTKITRTSPPTPRRSMTSSTKKATSCRDSAARGTGCTERGRDPRSERPRCGEPHR